MSDNSTIGWPTSLTAPSNSTYESISPLYHQKKPDDSGELMAFVTSCSKPFLEPAGPSGCLHKLEVDISTSFSQAQIDVTHEVLPGLGLCAQIIPVNKKLQVACFDKAYLMPIKNFGYKKTFNSDVRGSIHIPCRSLSVLAADSSGLQVATGSVDGQIALFTAREEEVSLLSNGWVTGSYITGLSYLQPRDDMCARPDDEEVLSGENMLIYSSNDGIVGVLDSRVALGDQFQSLPIMRSEPTRTFRSLCVMKSLPSLVVYLGTERGELISLDLRMPCKFIQSNFKVGDGYITHMKEVIVPENSNENKTFIAYTNSTNNIRILDAATLEPDEGWIWDRKTEEAQVDFCQIGNRIITCGKVSSIGCWQWRNTSNYINLPS